MRYTKLAMAGLAAVLTLNGAAAVFAEDEAVSNTQKPAYMERKNDIDMSSLDLPEDFVPFDEAHVPDGKNAPANGELSPIEFDEEGNMLFGQRPEGMPPMMDGERPELPEGEMPALDGERPELPEGEMPAFNGERPEFLEGEMPASDGERPELPEGGMPAFDNGGMQQMPGDFQPAGTGAQDFQAGMPGTQAGNTGR